MLDSIHVTVPLIGKPNELQLILVETELVTVLVGAVGVGKSYLLQQILAQYNPRDFELYISDKLDDTAYVDALIDTHLASDTDVIAIDSIGWNTTIESNILDMIADLCKDGMKFFITTQDTGLAERIQKCIKNASNGWVIDAVKIYHVTRTENNLMSVVEDSRAL